MKPLFSFKNVDINILDNKILKNINIDINKGDCVVILGPNGEGKSTLLKSIMGSNSINISSGEIIFNEQIINNLPIDQRSLLGIFLINQNPIEIEGITQLDFYKSILKAHNKKVNAISLYKDVEEKLKLVNLNKDVLTRFLNYDFSGGEKKKNEIIQMLLINPELILIDEIDSGLDVDAISNIANILNEQKKIGKTLVFITHNIKLIELLKPNKSILIANHSIAKIDDYNFAIDVMNKGFNKIFNELKINIDDNHERLDVCLGKKNEK